MKLKVYSIGKLRLKSLGTLLEEYVERINHYLPCQNVTLKNAKDCFSKIEDNDFLVLLDENGQSYGSTTFSKWLEVQKLRSVKNLVFLVGPAEGVTEAIKKRANLVLSLSKMTLQHELALVVLLEQLYRACTILRGEPYHK